MEKVEKKMRRYESDKKFDRKQIIERTTIASVRENSLRKDEFFDVNRISSRINNNDNRISLPIDSAKSTLNFKIVLIGDISVGKSSIIKRYIDNSFSEEYTCTIGTELFKKTVIIADTKKINLYIWDTCGQEKFRAVTRQYYRDTQAVLLVFDLTNINTFNNLSSWMDDLNNYVSSNCLIFLIGNKKENKKERKIQGREIKMFLKKNPTIKKYFEVSALTGEFVELAFDKINNHLIINFEGEQIIKKKENNEQIITIYNRKSISDEQKFKCC